jgi:hypothetical protein
LLDYSIEQRRMFRAIARLNIRLVLCGRSNDSCILLSVRQHAKTVQYFHYYRGDEQV